MKSLLSSLLILSSLSFSSYALEECPVQLDNKEYLEEVAVLAKNASSCYEASEIVSACALGASGDVYTVGAATQRCRQDLPALTEKDQQTFDYLIEKCDKKYENQEGTMYLSMHAFCKLSVTQLFSDLYSDLF